MLVLQLGAVGDDNQKQNTKQSTTKQTGSAMPTIASIPSRAILGPHPRLLTATLVPERKHAHIETRPYRCHVERWNIMLAFSNAEVRGGTYCIEREGSQNVSLQNLIIFTPINFWTTCT